MQWVAAMQLMNLGQIFKRERERISIKVNVDRKDIFRKLRNAALQFSLLNKTQALRIDDDEEEDINQKNSSSRSGAEKPLFLYIWFAFVGHVPGRPTRQDSGGGGAFSLEQRMRWRFVVISYGNDYDTVIRKPFSSIIQINDQARQSTAGQQEAGQQPEGVHRHPLPINKSLASE